MKITFQRLKNLQDSLESGDVQKLCDYLNSFSGNNIYEKFQSILRAWELQVNANIHLKLHGNPTSITIDYFLSQFPSDMVTSWKLPVDNWEVGITVPAKFSPHNGDVIMMDIIESLSFSGASIDLTTVSVEQKRKIIENLPGKLYKAILNEVLHAKNPIVEFSHRAMSDYKINFLSVYPYEFFVGLFKGFPRDHFREILFVLSKRVDSRVIMNSTMADIEFYLQKYTEEKKAGIDQNIPLQ